MRISKRFIIFFISFTVLGVVVSGCSMLNRMQIEPTVIDGNEAEIEIDTKETEAKDQVITYVDNKRGFALDFPKSWEGYYVVNELSEETIQIAFSGKSEYGKGFNEEANEYTGLQMFIIFKDDGNYEFLDSVRDIGAIDGVNYCYATSTDYIIAGLADGSAEDSAEDMESDFKKVTKMEQDVDRILETFRAHP